MRLRRIIIFVLVICFITGRPAAALTTDADIDASANPIETSLENENGESSVKTPADSSEGATTSPPEDNTGVIDDNGEMSYTPIIFPYSESSALSTEDKLSLRGTYGKGYSFCAEAGQQIIIMLNSGDFDAYLYLLDENKTELMSNDDRGGYGNSKIECTLEYTGIYYIQATQCWQMEGTFEIIITDEPPPLSATEELRELLFQNEGRTVNLTQDIVLDQNIFIDITQPTTVLMGDYCISIPAGTIFSTSGHIRFEGNGVQKPLFHIGGFLDMMWAEITANGDGATAVYLEGDYSRLDFMRITALGADSTAIHAEGYVDLRFCEVVAGGTALISDTDEIMIDACRVTPEPANAKIIQREAVPGYRIQENGVCVEVGCDLSGELWEEQTGYYFLDAERREEYANGSFINTSWDNLPPDANVPGEYSILCRPADLPDWFPVEVDAFEVPLHIIAQNQPHIQYAKRLVGKVVELNFFSVITDAEKLTLWYSYDDGQTWLDFAELPGTDVSSLEATADALPSNCVYMFRLEVTGGSMAGFSNTIIFPYYDSDPDADDAEGGGDRTGADRFPLGGKGGNNNRPSSGSKPENRSDGNTSDVKTSTDVTEAPPESGEPSVSVNPASNTKATIPGTNFLHKPQALSVPSAAPSLLLGENTDTTTTQDRTTHNNSEPQAQQPVFAAADSQPVSISVPIPDVTEPNAQPSVPKPPVDANTALLFAGIAAMILSALVVLIKIYRLRRRG